MGIILRILRRLSLLAILGLIGASIWFWFLPVGVNNYINKVTVELLFDSPELLTGLGMIDNTPLDFHSGRLSDYTKAQDVKSIAKLRRAREGLDRYGPKGLTGQELLSWHITAWYFDDLIRQGEVVGFVIQFCEIDCFAHLDLLHDGVKISLPLR